MGFTFKVRGVFEGPKVLARPLPLPPARLQVPHAVRQDQLLFLLLVPPAAEAALQEGAR